MASRARPPVVSIELLLDGDAEASVRADWDRLSAAGLSSLGAYRSASNRPHVTLLVRTSLPPLPFAAAGARLPVPLSLGEPVTFAHGERAVLARRVEPTDQLLALHRAVHDGAPAGEDAPHTAPGDWTPHVTLARRLRLDRLADALAVVGPPRSAVGIALRRWDSATATVTPLD